jgi:hypothetical protein
VRCIQLIPRPQAAARMRLRLCALRLCACAPARLRLHACAWLRVCSCGLCSCGLCSCGLCSCGLCPWLTSVARMRCACVRAVHSFRGLDQGIQGWQGLLQAMGFDCRKCGIRVNYGSSNASECAVSVLVQYAMHLHVVPHAAQQGCAHCRGRHVPKRLFLSVCRSSELSKVLGESSQGCVPPSLLKSSRDF